ncbi:MAG: outer rane receptor protein [Gammaproteobacteria bacterium]|nr:outer rane receptor protein [Gammaproteobacteria bacterium]
MIRRRFRIRRKPKSAGSSGCHCATVVTSTDLLNEGVTDTASLSLAVPGLSYTQGANAATPFIRGIGTTTNAVGNEASVATYVDNVYISSVNASLFELNNIDHIEVLKGLQGTLFGRNARLRIVLVKPILTDSPSRTGCESGAIP